jgi:radical SAM superfamily enzyme YgiQ (UPF0313 family)
MIPGRRIVLTASRAEMSQYGPEVGDPADAFLAFTSTFPQRYVRLFIGRYFAPMNDAGGQSKFAPYSLRKIEAALGGEGSAGDVVVCHPDNLRKFVGPRTEVVGITAMDPLGRGYVSVTYNSLIPFGKVTVNEAEFRRLMNRVSSLKEKHFFKVVVGGAGAWQIERSNLQAAFGIDTLVHGRADADLSTTMDRIIAGSAPPVVHARPAALRPEGLIPTIRKPAIYGDVEITRGCGRGCAFCSPHLVPGESVPLEEVMKEVEVNIRGGTDSIFTITDDLFLYGSKDKFIPNRRAIVDLFESIAGYPGVKWIHLSHASLAPVTIDGRLLPELAPVLVAKSSRSLRGKRYATAEVGIESGSVGIMRKYMKGKAAPLNIDDWPRIVREGIALFNENDIYPLGTFIVGWPGETEREATETAELMDSLHAQGAKLFYTPVLFIPIDQTPMEGAEPALFKNLSRTQLYIIERCWEYNVEFWGSEIPAPWIRIVGLAARTAGMWRRLTGRRPTYIHDRLGRFLMRAKLPRDPGIRDRRSGS